MKTNFVQIRLSGPARTIVLIAFCVGLMSSPAFAGTDSKNSAPVPATVEVSELFTRVFRVDTNRLVTALREKSLLDGTNIQSAILELFQNTNVDLRPPKSLFFDGRKGTLTARASADDLDAIEVALDNLSIVPRQVNIKTRFIQIPTNSDWSEAVDWYKEAVATNHQFFTATLTDAQLREVLNLLEKRSGADELNEGQVTTLSGRQAQFSVVEVKTMPDNANSTPTAGAQIKPPVKYDANTDAFGTTLDVVPTVTADGSSVELTLIPTVTIPPTTKGGQAQLFSPTPVKCTIKDGDTVAIGGLPSTDKNAPNSKIIVFATATLIDAAGNRIHSEDYYDTPRRRGGGFGGGRGPAPQ